MFQLFGKDIFSCNLKALLNAICNVLNYEISFTFFGYCNILKYKM